jgi:hypothetical protein
MRSNLPKDSVVAANWDYGSHINVLSEKATIIDEDHYIPYWIYLTYRHVFCAQTEKEALEFLKTRGATHILFTQRDIKGAAGLSYIGSNEAYDRQFSITPFVMEGKSDELGLNFSPVGRSNVEITIQGRTYSSSEWRFNRVEVLLGKNTKARSQHYFVEKANVVLQLNGRTVTLPLKRVYIQGIEYITAKESVEAFPGGMILSLDKAKNKWCGIYLPEVGYNSLIIQLGLLAKKSPYFKLVYPPKQGNSDNPVDNSVKIWEIIYPKDLEFHPEYLVKTFEDPRLYASWMLGKEVKRAK